MTGAGEMFEELYQGYAYSYPHKHAYRRFEDKISLRHLWKDEEKTALFLYLHIPFCEMRCGFCNLFTIANPKDNAADAYLEALRRQAEEVAGILGEAAFGQMAVGGGTPTFLEMPQMEKLFYIVEEILHVSLPATPLSFEMSPKTITREKLQLLYDKHTDRVSMGIQSFIEQETKSMGRPQQVKEVYDALELIRAFRFPVLNVDLIYGAAGQTKESWLYSLREALRFEPEEIYLYPLYVRPLTGLEKMGISWDHMRRNLYRAGRDYLLERDYEQVSMRMFRRRKAAGQARTSLYRCQEDGMVGLGAGARSYTTSVHYSSEYAVGRPGVKEIIADYIARSQVDFAFADYGFQLSLPERKRRFVIKSLLHNDGLDTRRYRELFGSDVTTEFPYISQLEEGGYAVRSEAALLRLTATGMEHSDAIGPCLYSDDVKKLIQEFELK